MQEECIGVLSIRCTISRFIQCIALNNTLFIRGQGYCYRTCAPLLIRARQLLTHHGSPLAMLGAHWWQ